MSNATSPLLHSRWFGKALGAVIALIFSPADLTLTVFWLTVAIIAGHQLDLLTTHYAHPRALGRLGGRPRHHDLSARETLAFTFAAMGYISKASGRVAPRHIDYVEQLMSRLGIVGLARKDAITWFTRGKTGFDEILAPSEEQFGADPALADMALECLCMCAHQLPNQAARDALVNVTQLAGFDPVAVTAKCREVESIQLRLNPTLTAAFHTLGIEPTQDLAQVKLSYRRWVARYHPDRLPVNATRAEYRHAERRLVEFREAFETIESVLY